jgi:hypothetical protein
MPHPPHRFGGTDNVLTRSVVCIGDSDRKGIKTSPLDVDAPSMTPCPPVLRGMSRRGVVGILIFIVQ